MREPSLETIFFSDLSNIDAAERDFFIFGDIF